MSDLFKGLARWLGRSRPRDHRTSVEESDASWDPENPFPGLVTIEFSDVLDLHSIPPRQVRAVVDGYLEEAHARDIGWVRIIHGRGIGVQREIVRSVLSSKHFVTDFSDAPAEAGGWGATVVTLSTSQRENYRRK